MRRQVQYRARLFHRAVIRLFYTFIRGQLTAVKIFAKRCPFLPNDRFPVLTGLNRTKFIYKINTATGRVTGTRRKQNGFFGRCPDRKCSCDTRITVVSSGSEFFRPARTLPKTIVTYFRLLRDFAFTHVSFSVRKWRERWWINVATGQAMSIRWYASFVLISI